MLCLMTLADVEAVSPETLTPWKEELLWRLYVDTYNHLTLGYGDELIERDQAGLTELLASRPADISEARSRGSSKGCRAAICSSSRARPSTATCGCRATSARTKCTLSLEQQGTRLGADRRHARQAVPVLEHLRRAVVLRHGHPARPRDDQPERPGARRVPVHRPGALPRAERRRAASRCSSVLDDVVSGRADVTERLRGRERERVLPRSCRALRAGHSRRQHASRRYTILDIVADNALGLLYRISRVISRARLRRRSRADRHRRATRRSTCFTSPRRATS